MNRYDVVTWHNGDYTMEAADDGEWVRFAEIEMRWRLMDSAPAVGAVLLYWPYWSEEPVIGYRVSDTWWTEKWLGDDAKDPGPTHWMPLPDPPKAGE